MAIKIAEKLTLLINGFNQPRLLSALKNDGIIISQISQKNQQQITINIAKKDSQKAFAILRKLCYNYSVVSTSGVATAFRSSVVRAGLIISLIFFSVLLGLSRGFIWQVCLTGNQNVPQQLVINALKANDISVGKSLKNIDKNLLENQLNAISGVLGSTVEISGTTVKITLIESTDFKPPITGEIKDIISNYDAEITRIVAHQGTPIVARGSRVKKGDSLIGAYRLNPEGNKAQQVSAQGQVYGKVNFCDSRTFSTTQISQHKTGKKYSSSIVSIFKLNIGKVKNPFTTFVAQTETMHMFSGNLLPLKLTRKVFYETEIITQQLSAEQRAKQLEQQSVLQNVIKAGGQAIEVNSVTTALSDGNYRLDVFITAEMPLSV